MRYGRRKDAGHLIQRHQGEPGVLGHAVDALREPRLTSPSVRVAWRVESFEACPGAKTVY